MVNRWWWASKEKFVRRLILIFYVRSCILSTNLINFCSTAFYFSTVSGLVRYFLFHLPQNLYLFTLVEEVFGKAVGLFIVKRKTGLFCSFCIDYLFYFSKSFPFFTFFLGLQVALRLFVDFSLSIPLWLLSFSFFHKVNCARHQALCWTFSNFHHQFYCLPSPKY